MPHNEWPRNLAKFDLGLIPLNGRYDARRSWIKSLEYTLMGIPWVGTKSPPTDELAEFGYQVPNKVEAWEKAIQNIIDNYEDAKARVVSGFETAEKADVRLHTQELLDIYQNIYNTFRN